MTTLAYGLTAAWFAAVVYLGGGMALEATERAILGLFGG